IPWPPQCGLLRYPRRHTRNLRGGTTASCGPRARSSCAASSAAVTVLMETLLRLFCLAGTLPRRRELAVSSKRLGALQAVAQAEAVRSPTSASSPNHTLLSVDY